MIFNQGVSFLVFLDNNLEVQPVAQCGENPTRNRVILTSLLPSMRVVDPILVLSMVLYC